MNKKHQQRINIFNQKTFLFFLIALLFLSSCGSSGSGDPVAKTGPLNGEIDGTGTYLTPIEFAGKAAIGAALAGQNIKVKALSGLSVSSTTNSNGDFKTPAIDKEPKASQSRYLLSVTTPDKKKLYSIAYRSRASVLNNDNHQVIINIHPFTDLMIRYWFAQEGLDITQVMDADNTINRLPSIEEVSALSDQFLALLENALSENSVQETQINSGTDLLSAPFSIGDAFDQFLDNTQVTIVNGRATVTAQDPNNAMAQPAFILNNVDISVDIFALNEDPVEVENLRAMNSEDGAVNLAWSLASDTIGITGYRVYRNGEFLASTLFPYYIDNSALINSQYEYAIESVNSSGNISLKTIIDITVVVDSNDTTPPAVPTNIFLTQATTPAISWITEDFTDVAKFEVLRGTDIANITNVIGSTTGNFFADDSAPEGIILFYAVVAIDISGNRSQVSAPVAFDPASDPTIPTALPSVVEFSQTQYLVNESARNSEITVIRRGNTGEAIAVNYMTTAISASANDDFIPQNGTLLWDAGDNAAKKINIALISNPDTESLETFTLTLTMPSDNADIGINQVTTITIEDASQENCIIVNEDITEDTLWSAPCYNIETYLNVSNEATLTIAPGTQAIFDADYSLQIDNDGLLIANGTAAAPIIFTGNNPSIGYWAGIDIRSSGTSEMSHVLIEYAGQENNNLHGALNIQAAASIENITLRQGLSRGLTVQAGAIVKTLSTLSISNFYDYPIVIPANAIATLSGNNTFSQNATLLNENKNYIKVANNSDLSLAQTWLNHGIPYLMPRVSMEISAALNVNPGTQLTFLPSSTLRVTRNGQLQAQGTQDNPIRFTGLNKIKGSWGGIGFISNANNNILDHTIIEYAGGQGGNTTAGVGAFGPCRLTLTNSELTFNATYGFEFDYGIELTFANNIIHNNDLPGTIAVNDINLLDEVSTYTGNDVDLIRIYASSNDRVLANITLRNLGVPYRWLGTTPTTIYSHLTVLEGAEIKFSTGGGLRIDDSGELTIAGSSEAPVKLTGIQTIAGAWDGVQIYSNSDANTINHAVIEYAGNSTGFAQASIHASHQSKLVIDNTAITNSQNYGIAKSIRTDQAADVSIGADVSFMDNAAMDIFEYSTISF